MLKRILEDSKKHKKTKWWETTRKYMNWAQIEKLEIKERTAKEIRGNIAKVVQEEWREEPWHTKEYGSVCYILIIF